MLWLKDNDTLVWSSKRAIGPKQWHKLNLNSVQSVQVRCTANIQR